jgi:hypothetical protein
MVCTDFAPVVPKLRASIVAAAVEIAVVADAQDWSSTLDTSITIAPALLAISQFHSTPTLAE